MPFQNSDDGMQQEIAKVSGNRVDVLADNNNRTLSPDQAKRIDQLVNNKAV